MVISKFILEAKEIDVDAVAADGEVTYQCIKCIKTLSLSYILKGKLAHTNFRNAIYGHIVVDTFPNFF